MKTTKGAVDRLLGMERQFLLPLSFSVLRRGDAMAKSVKGLLKEYVENSQRKVLEFEAEILIEKGVLSELREIEEKLSRQSLNVRIDKVDVSDCKEYDFWVCGIIDQRYGLALEGTIHLAGENGKTLCGQPAMSRETKWTIWYPEGHGDAEKGTCNRCRKAAGVGKCHQSRISL